MDGLERPTLQERAGFVTLTFVLPGAAAPKLQWQDVAKRSEKTSVKMSEKTSGKTSVKKPEKTSEKASEKTSVKASEKTATKTSGKTPESILLLVVQNPLIATAELSLVLGISTRSVARNLCKLQQAQRLVRVGGAKGGHWKVLQVLPSLPAQAV